MISRLILSVTVRPVFTEEEVRALCIEYDADRKKAFIPNYEVETAFEAALQTGEEKEIRMAIKAKEKL